MTGASRDLVVGVDAGGTGTRAVAATVEGAVVGRGSGGPGNPTAHGIPVAVGSLVAAVRSALRGQDGTRVVRVLIAGAGGGAVIAPDLPAALAAALAAEGLAAPVDYRPDVEAAYAAGTADPDGYVLVAGTGAAACEIAAGAMVRYVDGNGWLVGDDGSGFWLGREAVRAALAALDGRGGPTRLVER
ncbi:MAG TPA: BadF/BadG/BcrA/BcrD ATPase family protein, partial [Rugosimonospora sp.]|nr:BadF/BadG/BcrA/BcrD ATPase family protein [Rugosimonospora sp.]